jgi:hypothetical protein
MRNEREGRSTSWNHQEEESDALRNLISFVGGKIDKEVLMRTL